MADPKASVVLSVHNGGDYLRTAIDSILQQTFEDIEFVIVDDCSTDDTPGVLRSYSDRRIRHVCNLQRIGLTRSLNRGFAEARGEFIARQDADDLSLPERLATQIDYLQRHEDVGLLGTAYYLLDSQGQRVSLHRQPASDTEIRWQMLFHNAFCHTSVMLRRGLVGGSLAPYDEALPYSQDYELWSRLLAHTRAANLQTPLVGFRAHGSSISATQSPAQQSIATHIAWQQIAALAPDLPLTESEVQTLRSWYYTLPKPLAAPDLAHCRTLLEILCAFARQSGVDRHVVTALRRRWARRILAAVPVAEAGDLWKSGVIRSLLRPGSEAAAHQCAAGGKR